MHDGFCIPADATAPPIGRQSVKYALANILHRVWWDIREPAQSSIAISLLINSGDFILDTLRNYLKELLGVLMFAGVEERVGPAFCLAAESLNDVGWTNGVVR